MKLKLIPVLFGGYCRMTFDPGGRKKHHDRQ